MGLYPKNINEYLVLQGIPQGRHSQVYIVDTVNGSDSYSGTSFKAPLATVEAAYAKLTADQHDAVVLVPGDTGNALAAAIDWSKDYTHLFAMSSLHGMGSRCRITGTTALDATQLVTFSGNGCQVRGVQFYNGADANADSGAVIVTGSRNHFKDCFFAGMAHATPAARAGSYSLKVSGSENLFERCAVGLDTIVRAAANPELWLASGATRNAFVRSRFLSASETATKVLVKADEGIDRWTEFEDCIFQNFSANWAVSLNNAFAIGAASTHQIILRGLNQLVGVTGWADTVTHIYSAAPVSNAGFGVAVQPTT